MMLVYELFDYVLCLLNLVLWCCRVDYCGIEHLSCRVYDRNLAACTECRIPSKHNLSCNWRLHEKLLQVLSEYLYGTILCFLCQIVSDFTLYGRGNKPVVRILHYLCEYGCYRRSIICDNLLFKIFYDILCRCLYLYCEDFFLLTTVNCECSVTCHLGKSLIKFIVHLIDRLCLWILGCRYKTPLLHGKLSDFCSVTGIVRYILCNDILCSGKCSRFICHVLFCIHIFSCFCHDINRRFLR